MLRHKGTHGNSVVDDITSDARSIKFLRSENTQKSRYDEQPPGYVRSKGRSISPISTTTNYMLQTKENR